MHLLTRNSVAKRFPQIGSRRRIQTAVPHAISGDATPVATGTERRRRRRNNTERRAVRQNESLSRGRPTLRHRLNLAVILAEYCQHRVTRQYFLRSPLVG